MKLHNKYQLALRVLYALKRRLNIVVIGANDGKTNDPIYDFVMARPATHVLLVEPNKPLLPYLRDNYAQHPSHQIANCAIGPEGLLTLYAVKREFWDQFQPAYAAGWPSYRAATGITSAIKSQLEKALAYQSINPQAAIDELQIPSKQLGSLLGELKWPVPVDVLQVDAEGYDDAVIYNCNLDRTRPLLLCFERHNLSQSKYQKLADYLGGYGYQIYRVGGDGLAVDGRRVPAGVLIRLVLLLHSALGSLSRTVARLSAAIR
jgi:FkbM family methyltransferase